MGESSTTYEITIVRPSTVLQNLGTLGSGLIAQGIFLIENIIMMSILTIFHSVFIF
jgi:hypothetical protein